MSVLIVGLTACSKKENETTDDKGACKPGYLDTHNDLASTVKSVGGDCREALRGGFNKDFYLSRCKAGVPEVLRKCDTYTANHPPGRTCRAVDRDTFQDVTVDTTTIHNQCATIREAARKDEEAQKTAQVTVTPAPETTVTARQATLRVAQADTQLSVELPTCEDANKDEISRLTAKMVMLKAKAEKVTAMAQLNQDMQEYLNEVRAGRVERWEIQSRRQGFLDRKARLDERYKKVDELDRCLVQ